MLIDDFGGLARGRTVTTTAVPEGTTSPATFSEAGGVATTSLNGDGNGRSMLQLDYDFPALDLTAGVSNTQFFMEFDSITRTPEVATEPSLSVTINVRDSSNRSASYNTGIQNVTDFNIVLNFECDDRPERLLQAGDHRLHEHHPRPGAADLPAQPRPDQRLDHRRARPDPHHAARRRTASAADHADHAAQRQPGGPHLRQHRRRGGRLPVQRRRRAGHLVPGDAAGPAGLRRPGHQHRAGRLDQVGVGRTLGLRRHPRSADRERADQDRRAGGRRRRRVGPGQRRRDRDVQLRRGRASGRRRQPHPAVRDGRDGLQPEPGGDRDADADLVGDQRIPATGPDPERRRRRQRHADRGGQLLLHGHRRERRSAPPRRRSRCRCGRPRPSPAPRRDDVHRRDRGQLHGDDHGSPRSGHHAHRRHVALGSHPCRQRATAPPPCRARRPQARPASTASA